ncbi:hypothetical protein [Saccharicrinis sp. FJH54]|uniref:hypothetical protein n=1 Tax=Saccharicrinis sp. FJH54 TaxID=3344665 RepID=UPI0035D4A038
MKSILILTLTVFCIQVFGQERKSPDEWYKDYVTNYGLDFKESKSELIDYDLAELFFHTPSSEIYGVIGDNMQRIQIKWISINKDPNNPENYFVYGKTKVKSNICEFTGIIKIKTVRLYPEGKYDLPYRIKIKPEKIGVLFCDYTLTENSNENHTGYFQGISATDFYINNDSLTYNNLRSSSDDMTNNQFVGTWTSYNYGTSKICNWGDYRVPNAPGFDCGAAEFSPCKEFEEYGWKNFKLANTYWQESEEIRKAREIENKEWWK